jgi:hypothetical protein
VKLKLSSIGPEPSPRPSPGVPGEGVILAPESALCLKCNYPLRGLTSRRCPECGREFDPADVWTMNAGRPMGAIAARLSKPTVTHFRAVLILLMLAIIWGQSWLPGAYVVSIFATLLAGVTVVYRAVRGLLRRIVLFHYRQRDKLSVRQIRARRFEVVITLLAVSSLIVNWPLMLHVLIARPALDQFAYDAWAVRPMLDPQPRDVTVALFPVDSIWVSTRGVEINIAFGGSLIYDPEGRIPRFTSRESWRLSGPWVVTDMYSAQSYAWSYVRDPRRLWWKIRERH